MSAVATAHTPTVHGDKYLQQLCKHWSHNLAVTVEPGRGRVTFPRDVRGADWPGDAEVTFEATDDTLVTRIAASVAAQRDGLKRVVAEHLDRFAFREAPLAFEWIDDQPASER